MPGRPTPGRFGFQRGELVLQSFLVYDHGTECLVLGGLRGLQLADMLLEGGLFGCYVAHHLLLIGPGRFQLRDPPGQRLLSSGFVGLIAVCLRRRRCTDSPAATPAPRAEPVASFCALRAWKACISRAISSASGAYRGNGMIMPRMRIGTVHGQRLTNHDGILLQIPTPTPNPIPIPIDFDSLTLRDFSLPFNMAFIGYFHFIGKIRSENNL